MKKIIARFNGTRLAITSPQFQYNYGQVLVFDDIYLPEYYQVHFANSKNGESVTAVGGSEGVTIPSEVFEDGNTIYAWVFAHDGQNEGETLFQVQIPIIARAAITNIEPIIRNETIPSIPTTDGTYTLKATVADGTVTYSWES